MGMVRRSRKLASKVRGIAYVRVSTSRQDLSPAAQGAAIASWAVAEGIEVVATFVDKGVSGAADVADRAGLAGALAFLQDRKGDIVALLVARRDRLARDLYVAGSIDRLAAKAGARVLSAEGSNGEDDALHRDILNAFSAEERRKIKRRTRDALAIKRARNELTGCAPYGKRLATDGVHLEPNPGEQQTIARALALSNQGLPVRAIAAALAREGFVNRAGRALAFQSIGLFLRPLLADI